MATNKVILPSITPDVDARPDFIFLETFDDPGVDYPRLRLLSKQIVAEFDKTGTPTFNYYPGDTNLLVSADRKFRKQVGSGVICAVDVMAIKMVGADGSKKANYFIGVTDALRVVNGDKELETAYGNFIKGGVARKTTTSNQLGGAINRTKRAGSKLSAIERKYPYPTLERDGVYVNTDVWNEIMLNMEMGQSILLYGPTGTAKTKIAKYVGKLLGNDFEKIDFGGIKNGISHLIGEHRIGENGTSVFDLAVFPQAIQKPTTILLDELNRAGDDVLNILLPILDDDRTLRLDMAPATMERRIKVNPAVRFIATANVGFSYTGTNVIDAALEDRFKFIELDYMPEDEEVYFLTKMTGVDTKIAKIIVKVATSVRKMFRAMETSKPVSIRGTHRIAQYAEAGFDLKRAFELALFPSYQPEEREQLMTIISSI